MGMLTAYSHWMGNRDVRYIPNITEVVADDVMVASDSGVLLVGHDPWIREGGDGGKNWWKFQG